MNRLQLLWDVWSAPRSGAEGITRRQRERLAALVAHARAKSRFYAEHYHSLPAEVNTIEQIPPVTKRELMARFDDWVTDPEVTRAKAEAFVADDTRVGDDFLGRYLVATTSGTTGVPGIILLDKETWAVINAVIALRSGGAVSAPKIMLQAIRKGFRSAAIFATEGHFFGVASIRRRIRQVPMRARYQKLYSALRPTAELVAELNAFQPVLLGGYTSAIALMAREQAAGRLRISPALVTVAGETLSPAVRKQIGDAFGCPVVNSYSASEVIGMTYECAHQHFHVNADWFIFEPVDAEMKPVPPGVMSHSVLVTNLANYAQPIIRYQLGDSVHIDPTPCPCGSAMPVIHVEGRTDEILTMPAVSGQPVHLLPLALETVIEDTPGIHRFQLVQTAPLRLELRMEASPGADPTAVWSAVQDRLNRYLGGQGIQGIELVRAEQLPTRNPGSGKLRHIWSEIR